MKRLFDFIVALLSLVALAPLFFIVAVAIKFDSRGAVFYRGERMGKDAKSFRIFKFRTMTASAASGGALTRREDPRITRVGKFLRRTKIDELPQLINVVKGEMSLVGPRPEDPLYLSHYSESQRKVLGVLPGITSVASIRYRREEELHISQDWERDYVETILPLKLDLELKYLASRSFWRDTIVLLATPLALLRDNPILHQLDQWLTDAIKWLEDRVPWVAVDIPLVILAYILAIAVRSITAKLDYPEVYVPALVGVGIYIGINHLFGIYRRFWRYASGQEVAVLFFATLFATGLIALLDYMLQERTLPLGAVALGGFFTFVFLVAVRYRRKLGQGAQQMLGGWFGFFSGQGARVLMVGAGEEGQIAVWRIQNQLDSSPIAYQIVGFVDDDPRKRGLRIHNVPVLGDRTMIPELVALYFIDLILIAISPSKVVEPRELLTLCRQTTAQVKVLPALLDWLKSDGRAPDWVDLTDEDLMQRSTYRADRAAGAALVQGRTVMVTGAAGSIGSELCRQIASYAPNCLVLVDVNESGLFDLQFELNAQFKQCPTQLVLCDIADPARLEPVFDETRPRVVFHAAAYKHVPILEEYPGQAIRVNVNGTRVVHALAGKYQAERFIFISSDKAVNPANVLGQTKRLGELMVAGNGNSSPVLSAAVRFGNVLGSRGSVLTTFERQIELGGPITITHPEMTRFFMSIDEAVNLVIQAAAMTSGGEIYVLDMGEPVLIQDLAHRLIRARGLRLEHDIAIEYVGARPGEKMNEELVAADEEKLATAHPSIFQIGYPRTVERAQLDERIQNLIEMAERGEQRAELKTALRVALSPSADAPRATA